MVRLIKNLGWEHFFKRSKFSWHHKNKSKCGLGARHLVHFSLSTSIRLFQTEQMLNKHVGSLFLAVTVFFISRQLCSASDIPASPDSPVSVQHIVRKEPNFSIYLVKIDLSDPRVSAHVSRGGSDPDGDGPWLTTLLPTSEIAAREHYDIAINGDFFVAEATVDIEGKKTGYIKGKSARPEGMAMTEGQLWHRPAKTAPYLEITSNNIAKLDVGGPNSSVDPAARQIVGGGQIIERNHQAVVYTNKFAVIRNPRTVVGIAKNGTQLVLLVVDGRQPKLSIGMTLSELADEMVRAGCDDAINLDGGGSTTLVYRDPTSHQLQILNSPSDGKERSVADILGVSVNAPLPEVK